MNKMKFEFEKQDTANDGDFIYREDECSFDFESKTKQNGITSLLVNDLNIELDPSGKLLHTWGLCPYQNWVPEPISPPSSIKSGSIYFKDSEPIVAGVSVQIAGPNEWKISVNKKNGWVCIGDSSSTPNSNAISFAIDQVAVLSDSGELLALWLKPLQLPRLTP